MTQPNERALTAQELNEFRACATQGLDLLTGKCDSDTPDAIVKALDEYVDAWHAKPTGFLGMLFNKKPDVVQASLALGSIWGDQIVKRFGWEWICLQHDNMDYYCVGSPDRALVVYPTYFVKACLDDPQVDCTAMLAFNMLAAGSIPPFPERSYENLMNGVHRVVPRR
jgi:hypothetical protein